MPRFLVPRHHGPHRIAGIALYRALLTQSQNVPLPKKQQGILRNVIRQSFRRNRHLTSQHKLRDAFTAGYRAIDILDASTAGDAPSSSRLTDLLSKVPTYLRRPLPLPQPERKPSNPLHRCPGTFLTRPAITPLPPGRRHIPIIVSANKIPILRFKKPQPENLSRVIRTKIRTTIRRHDTAARLEREIRLAEREDEWDGILRGGWGVRRGGEGRWVDGGREALGGVWDKVGEADERCFEVAGRMMEVVGRERRLAEMEREEGRRMRREERERVAEKAKMEGDGKAVHEAQDVEGSNQEARDRLDIQSAA